MVGAVLVHGTRIIGEGYHARYGSAHAEVNAVGSVRSEDRKLIPESTLYVSLEPCCIHGNTPPCTDLILDQKIPRVIISAIDQTAEVRGRGIEILRRAGVEVKTAILPEAGKSLAAVRNTFVSHQRPYITLKFARSKDGFFAPQEHQQIWLSNRFSKRLVHRWRSESAAILVGYSTALIDNPQLTNRFYFGGSPLRLTLDRKGKLPADLRLFDGSQATLVFTEKEKTSPDPQLDFAKIDFSEQVPEQILQVLYRKKISSLLIEGGVQTLQSFISAGLWDQAFILTGNITLGKGIPAPLVGGRLRGQYRIDDDELLVFERV
jgi:diaminohydroxyphosphoribosylaminopyrimidine deaminase/5-amino-6-(5-phosphoribosylamino)uracil reductase